MEIAKRNARSLAFGCGSFWSAVDHCVEISASLTNVMLTQMRDICKVLPCFADTDSLPRAMSIDLSRMGFVKAPPR
jgi:hypothetical protein